MTWPLILGIVCSPIAALLVSAAIYPRFAAIDRPKGASADVLGRFVGGVLGYGFSFGVVGWILGTAGFCLADSGAQCGLGGIFITGPLGFTCGVGWFLFKSIRRAP
jgi:hypothetical protein